MTYTFKLSRRLAAMGAVVLLSVLAACGGDRPNADLTQPDTSAPVIPAIVALDVAPSLDTLFVGAAQQFAATARDAGGTAIDGQRITWRSSDTAVAAVSALGVVAARAAGTAWVVALAGTVRDSARVVVAAPAPEQPAPEPVAGWFVTPGGSSGGDGSLARPWNLATALSGAGGRIQPGDTVWLRGGTYGGTYRATVSGTAGRFVVFRQYPGERATIDARGAAGTASTLTVEGAYTAFWGFEITNSNTTRSVSFSGNAGRAHGIYNKASHTRYINLTVHDAGVALYSSPTTYDVEVAGSLFYNNGWSGPDRGHGHAVYVRSNTGPVTIRDNVMYAQFGYGVHAYSNPGEGYLNNIRVEGNVSFNNGTLATNSTAANILLGGDETSTGGVVRTNYTYHSAGVTGNNVEVGFGSLANGTVTVERNVMAGGSPVLEVGYWSAATIRDNTMVGTGTLLRVNDGSGIAVSGSLTYSGALTPAANLVVVRANPYEAGRATIVVYNWTGAGAAAVSLAGIVPAGRRYEIRNAQNPFGAPVASGTMDGAAVTVPLSAVTPPAATGWSRRAPSTGTQFHAFVVTMPRVMP